jgi:hypothetical protein
MDNIQVDIHMILKKDGQELENKIYLHNMI